MKFLLMMKEYQLNLLLMKSISLLMLKKLKKSYLTIELIIYMSLKKTFMDLDTNNFSEVKVPEDHFFVLGDNRDNSQDSRYIGFIPKNNLVGRAEISVFIF